MGGRFGAGSTPVATGPNSHRVDSALGGAASEEGKRVIAVIALSGRGPAGYGLGAVGLDLVADHLASAVADELGGPISGAGDGQLGALRDNPFGQCGVEGVGTVRSSRHTLMV